MPFESALYPGETVIDDSTPMSNAAPPSGQSRGLMLQKRTIGYGAIPCAPPFDIPLIPRNEWRDRIEEMERTKTRLSDLINQAGLSCLDQNGTNYCWGNAPTHCVEISRIIQNQPLVRLSPASVCGPIRGFVNEGGWGGEAMQYGAEKGWTPASLYPVNAIKDCRTPHSLEVALSYRATEWMEAEPNNIDQLVTMGLLRIPVAGGFNWWSHEITMVDPIWVNGKIAYRIRNSWGMNWPTNGAGGWSTLQGSKMSPDDHQGLRSTTPSEIVV